MKRNLWLIGAVLTTSSGAFAESFNDNLRWSIDLSSRVQHVNNADKTAYIQAIGLDSHRVLTTDTGDWGTLVTQVYATRIDNLSPHPGFFDDDHDWELVYRIFNLNVSRWADSFANIKIGHIELPFGLEHTITTNGNLRDYNHGRNLGPKADWGIGLNNQYQNWEYEVTLTSGGGQSLDRGDDSYILAGRVGSNRDQAWVVGFSAYKADLSGLERKRVAIDIQHYVGLFGLMLEVAGGSKGAINQLDSLAEVNWRTSDESLLVYGQFQYFSENRPDTEETAGKWVAGMKYTPDQHWDMSANVSRDVKQFSGKRKDTKLALQLRYRF